MPLRRAQLGGFVSMIAESIRAVEPIRYLKLTEQRTFRARIYGHVDVAQFDREQSIAGSLCNRNVSRNHGYGGDANFGRAQRHNERHGVVRSCVSVDEK